MERDRPAARQRDRGPPVAPQLLQSATAPVADGAFVDGSHLFHKVFVGLTFAREVVRPAG